ncbi:MAG TPA: T9SS type A sorting domain-containing protein [Chitinophagales bacterium]|nr:T9SS type A sorting domain-containing protein [Chitinophagales bacterium]
MKKVFTSAGSFLLFFLNYAAAQTCDTLSNVRPDDTLALYRDISSGKGYISGHNGFGDISKADKFANMSAVQVTGAIYYFAVAQFGSPSSAITAAVWDNTGAGGSPGNMVASETVLISDIAQDVAGNMLTYVPFSSPPTLSDDFYVGITFGYDAGDTVALVTNQNGSNTPTGWEQFSSGAWYPYSSTQSWGLDIANVILPIVCPAQQVTCDTLLNMGLNDSLALYGVPPPQTGYVSGHNSYGDISKADSFANSTLREVRGAFYYFGVAQYGNVNSSITAAVWDNTGAGGSPGNIIASRTLLISDIAQDVTNNMLTYVPFIPPAVVSNNFYVGITFSYVPGDTVALVTNRIGSNTPTGWEQFGNGSWHPYHTAPPSWGIDVAHFIAPIVCDVTCPAITVTTTPTNSICTSSNGSATASANGGTAPYTYTWNTTPPQSSATATGLAPGVYSVTATDANGCTGFGSVTILASVTNLNVAVSAADNTSCSAPNGSANATVTGGTSPYSYVWSTGSSAQTISDLAAGLYSVTVFDANGCSGTGSGNVSNNPPSITLTTISTTPNSQCLNPNGSATVSASGGPGPFTYQWNAAANNQTGATATNLEAGNYTVTATGASGCTGSATVTIGSAAPAISVNATANTPNSSCAAPNGSVTVSASGGTGPYTYAWDNGTVGETASGLSGGNYSVTATDANGCNGLLIVTVGSITPVINVSVTSSSPHTSCVTPDGSAMVEATGGTGPYSYLWNNGTAGPAAAGLSAGNYTVTATDFNSCTGTATVTIGSTAPVIAVSVTNSTANTSCINPTGSATVSASSGAAPYNFTWSSGHTGASASGLASGNYTVTAQDANGCTGTGTVTIADNRPVLSVSVATSPVTSCVSSNGSATATITGTLGMVTYTWSTSPLQTGATATNLAAGSYTVTALDQNSGCTATGFAVIGTNTPAVNVSITASNGVTNCITPNGSATAAASGGGGGFNYVWSTVPAQTGATASSLAVGAYSVTATDVNGCTGTASVVINDNTAPVTVNTSSTDVTSCTTPNGSAFAAGSGGTPPYAYSWSNGSASSTLNNISAGVYSVTVTDANDCEAIGSVSVNTDINSPTVNASATNETSANANNGTATALPGGGTPPYSYDWSNGGTSSTVSGLDAGTYTVTVTDANDCSASASVTVQTDVGIGDLKNVNSFSLFPNPTNDDVTLKLELNEVKAVSIKWYNALGQEVMARTSVKSKFVEEHFSLSALPQGIYLLRVKIGNEELTERVTLAR